MLSGFQSLWRFVATNARSSRSTPITIPNAKLLETVTRMLCETRLTKHSPAAKEDAKSAGKFSMEDVSLVHFCTACVNAVAREARVFDSRQERGSSLGPETCQYKGWWYALQSQVMVRGNEVLEPTGAAPSGSVKHVVDDSIITAFIRYRMAMFSRGMDAETFDSDPDLDIHIWIAYYLYLVEGVVVSIKQLRKRLQRMRGILARARKSAYTYLWPVAVDALLPGFTPPRVDIYLVMTDRSIALPLRISLALDSDSRYHKEIPVNMDSLCSSFIQLKSALKLKANCTVSFCVEGGPEMSCTAQLRELPPERGDWKNGGVHRYCWIFPFSLTRAMERFVKGWKCSIRQCVTITHGFYEICESVHGALALDSPPRVLEIIYHVRSAQK
ncbi:hypothetical protein NMY22_g1956 [Coprinellus aureogranulatus]|nr:hypothetical protein NMY22_g1956 [Coprinellus aureogranulatus]